ncbi:MAG TPA: ABC transporter ATP-binding protein/permease [Stellaceae bacterium]|nr:ABC transporter ATP-binding protein/permease [Stellaceae bacterium]
MATDLAIGQTVPPLTNHGSSPPLAALARVYREMSSRRTLLIFAAAIATVIILNAFTQVRLNLWQGSFYESLNRRDGEEFVRQLGIFIGIIAGLVVLGVSQTWLQESIKLRLREGLTRDLLDQWLRPKRAYRLALTGAVGANPDQRLQEDARHLSELTGDLMIGLFQASVLLVSFVGVLWVLSEHVRFPVGDRSVAIHGYMVWCALVYALAGSALVLRVGRPLVPLNAEHYAREAAFRSSLVRVSQSAEGIALDGGEKAERHQLALSFAGVLEVMSGLVTWLARLTWLTSSYGYLAIVVPFVVASPGYFGGTLSFGDLMVVVGAFTQVQQALRWFVDNFPRIADWQATFGRIMEFYDALVALEAVEAGAAHLTVTDDPSGHIGWKNLGVLLLDGRSTIEEESIELRPGDHVQIIGEPQCGKTTLFRVFAGIWPLGFGSLAMPARETIAFLPQRPYIPLGTLRAALAYPGDPGALADDALRHALERVGLSRLAGQIDREARWDEELTQGEQHRLAFARVILRAPSWVIADGVFQGLDPESRQIIRAVVETDLAQAGIIEIASAPNPFFGMTMHLRRASDGAQESKDG